MGINLVVGSIKIDYEFNDMFLLKEFSIILNCFDGRGMFIVKLFFIKVVGKWK